jgi:hypothetical protein
MKDKDRKGNKERGEKINSKIQNSGQQLWRKLQYHKSGQRENDL